MPYADIGSTFQVPVAVHYEATVDEQWQVAWFAIHSLKNIQALATTAHQWDQAISATRELTLLQANWDGRGAIGIDTAVIQNVIQALRSMAGHGTELAVPEVCPSTAGTVSLVWDFDDLQASLEFGLTRYAGYIEVRHQPIIYVEGDARTFGQQDREFLASAIHNNSFGVSLASI